MRVSAVVLLLSFLLYPAFIVLSVKFKLGPNSAFLCALPIAWILSTT